MDGPKCSLRLEQERPTFPYQEVHFWFLSSVASRVTIGKSPGGAPSGVAFAIDAGRKRTSEGARSYSSSNPPRDGLERVGTIRLPPNMAAIVDAVDSSVRRVPYRK
jgi:hypothetical protein